VRGSIRRDRGAWSFVVDDGVDPSTGKRRQIRRRGFPTRAAAEAALAEIVHAARRGGWVEPSSQPIGEYLEEWLAAVRPTIEPSTWSGYATKMRRCPRPMANPTSP
jgi:hypothetical protein